MEKIFKRKTPVRSSLKLIYVSIFYFLCLKYYIYSCKFQKKEPNFEAFVSLIKFKENLEYKNSTKKEQITGSFQKLVHSF